MKGARNNISMRTRKKKKKVFSKFLFRFMMFIFLAVLVYIVLFSPLVTISSVKIFGNNQISEASILEKVTPKITGKFLGLIKKDNFILLNKAGLKKDLLENFKLIRSVKIKKRLNAGLEIEIIERMPTLVVCNNSCFLMDETGEIYNNYNSEEGNERENNLMHLNDESREIIEIGDMVLEPEHIEYILDLKNKLKEELNLETKKDFYVPNLTSKNIKVSVQENWDIYFNENVKLEREIEILRAVLKDEIGTERQADLKYIDLRVDNKVFYKFREGTPSRETQKRLETAQEKSASEESAKDEDKKDEN